MHAIIAILTVTNGISIAIALYYRRKAKRAYAQGATDQAQISNRRHEVELRQATERAFNNGLVFNQSVFKPVARRKTTTV